MYGYALALFARALIERKSDLGERPAGPTCATACVKGLAYLEARNQTLIPPKRSISSRLFHSKEDCRHPNLSTRHRGSHRGEKGFVPSAGSDLPERAITSSKKYALSARIQSKRILKSLSKSQHDEPARTQMAQNLLLWGLLFSGFLVLLF